MSELPDYPEGRQIHPVPNMEGARNLVSGKVLTFHTDKPEVWAILSEAGELLKFDNKKCRELSKKWDSGDKNENNCIAKLIMVLLEEAAQEFDYMPSIGGGTFGDLVRKVHKEEEIILKDKNK